MVTSHPKAIRKLHACRTDFDKILKRSASISYELNVLLDPGISSIFSKDDAPLSVIDVLIELPFLTANRYGGQLHFHHLSLHMIYPVMLPRALS